MKKTPLFILSTLAALFLASCNENTSKESESSFESDPDSSLDSSSSEVSVDSSGTYTEDDKAFEARIRNTLSEMKKGNFTLSYDFASESK